MDKESIIKTAKDLYLEKGFSCSESILHALNDSGIEIPAPLVSSVSGLRAGIGGSGCICGALMAAVLASGYLYGQSEESRKNPGKLAASLHDKFKAKFKTTCCRALTGKYNFNSRERKEACASFIEFMISELADIIIRKKS
ncbi:hypothetical protein A2310_00030 [candidate division WOR-1 bacterium RIFOXYB2_FULL_37_13]|uniref:C_GCAxxG_C_C family protein n=1 Tax=candidate division WOR-1 bacterium RIFOXYB2_FULL_37_13 TaxID=1802579 RepID=A0A1F4SZ01_UNCSA|nr:MAG: hypothetical protein A2310_00030 [candidate division WOR-1 bacterium RIFOXYB2_FULL_37_13]